MGNSCYGHSQQTAQRKNRSWLSQAEYKRKTLSRTWTKHHEAQGDERRSDAGAMRKRRPRATWEPAPPRQRETIVTNLETNLTTWRVSCRVASTTLTIWAALAAKTTKVRNTASDDCNTDEESSGTEEDEDSESPLKKRQTALPVDSGVRGSRALGLTRRRNSGV